MTERLGLRFLTRRLARPTPAERAEAALPRAEALLAKSPTGRALLELARADGVFIHVDRHAQGGYYRPGGRRPCIGLPAIHLSAGDDGIVEEMARTLAHELRHHWQYAVQFARAGRPRLNHADEILLQRVMEADADAVATRVWREIHAAGAVPRLRPWHTRLCGRARILSRALRAAPGGEMAALRAGFDAWFDSYFLRRSYDDDSIWRLGARLDDSAPPQPAEFWRGFGRLPDGGDYLAATGGFDPNNPRYAGRLSRANRALLAELQAEAKTPADPDPERRIAARREAIQRRWAPPLPGPGFPG